MKKKISKLKMSSGLAAIATHLTHAIVLLLICSVSYAQQGKTVTGVVIEQATKFPVAGASVLEEGTTNGVITDFDGNFTIEVSSEDAVLNVSYLGFNTASVSVAGNSNFTIELSESDEQLDQVVIVGYGARKKTDVTGAISTIKAESFNQGVINAPEELLQAKIAGVRVTSTSGEPGAPTVVTIRGAGALRSGDKPLYVIDGIPISNEDTSPGGRNIVGSAIATTTGSSNPIAFLNPNDIASMDVLKDASATAIYGSRGANGVILITTKRGKKGQSHIDFNAYSSVSTISNTLDLATAADFGGGDVDTDWQDEIYRTAITNNYDLSYSNGSENSSIYVSLGVLDQEGIIERSELTRYTGRINTSFWALKDDKLKIDFNSTFSRTEVNAVPRANTADTSGELITNTISSSPIVPVLDANGDFSSSGRTNPVGLLNLYNDISETNRLLSSLTATYKITSNFSYQANFAIDYSTGTRQQEILPNTLVGVGFNNGSYAEGRVRSENLLFENFLTYKFKKNDHSFDFLLGYANQRFTRNLSSRQYVGYVLPNVSAIDNPSNAPTENGLPVVANEETTLESFFGRVNYAYGDRLDVTASLRADGTSKFTSGNKWGVFPAIAASYGFIISDDDKVINSLRGRIGWGQTGNQNVPGVPSQDGFTFTNVVGGIGIQRTVIGNPDLEWEISNQFNIGVDFSAFEGRLNGNIDYFNKVNEKMILFLAPEPPAVALGSWQNLPGDITNSGVEVLLGYDIFRKEDFNWNVSVNATYISNEVDLGTDQEFFTGAVFGPGLNGSFVQVIRSGEELGAFLLPTANPDGTVSDERSIQGSGIPNFVYGINTSLNYKNWDFSLNMSGVAGNKIYNNTAQFARNAGENMPVDVLNNTDNIPDGVSDYFLEDGDFLRLANTTLGYSFDMENSKALSKLRLYVTGQNLFTITDYSGYDPEVNTPNNQDQILAYGIDFAAYPRATTVILGLNVTF